jgi:hypothetical protein
VTRTLLLAGLVATAIAAPAAFGHQAPRAGAETLAVIGDIPYGPALIAEFPADIGEINADPSVRRVVHETFADPLVYTPGDNEWTDCHRADNGGYLPTERLATIRGTFFPNPGRTPGADRARVRVQSRAFPENVSWRSVGVGHTASASESR